MKIWLDASAFENEVLGQPAAESVELLTLSLENLD
jgi:hypothetical protein